MSPSSPTPDNTRADALEARLRRLEHLNRVSLALAAADNTEALIETIVLEAKRLCQADGGTLPSGWRQTEFSHHLERQPEYQNGWQGRCACRPGPAVSGRPRQRRTKSRQRGHGNGHHRPGLQHSRRLPCRRLRLFWGPGL